MCGINGIVSFTSDVDKGAILDMNKAIAHRGPDDEGYVMGNSRQKSLEPLRGIDTDKRLSHLTDIADYDSQSANFALAHRRFSIIDLSEKGHQPMLSQNDFAFVFNGEIFNFIELREELEDLGHTFSSDSDTEVILKAYAQWANDCFDKFNGFWAISIVDFRTNKLILSRDRFGQKPLYYVEKEGCLYFSSEIKGIWSVLPELKKIDPEAAYLYLMHDRRDSFHPCMLTGLSMVNQASFLEFDLVSGDSKETKYWDYPKVQTSEQGHSNEELLQKMDSLISESVKIRMRSDVPVSLNLSGGLDSGAIAHYIKELNCQAQITAHTFEYKDDDKLSEKSQAQLIADTCNIPLKTLVFDENDIWDNMRYLIRSLEEPIHDPAAFIQWVAWRKISEEGYKVILHGSANDELMLGYEYFADIIDKQKLRSGRLPLKLKGKSILHPKSILRIVKWTLTGGLTRNASGLVVLNGGKGLFKDQFVSLNTSAEKRFVDFVSGINTGEKRRLADFERLRIPFWNNFMDKSMMSIPIEVRFPFLDKDLVDFAFRIKQSFFYKTGWNKYLLRQLLNKKLPDQIVWDKTKKGFTSPARKWMRDNKDFVIKELSESPLMVNIVNIDFLKEHYSTINYRIIWRLVNFHLWAKEYSLQLDN